METTPLSIEAEAATDVPPRKAEDTKRRILLAAQETFAEKGYSQASIRDIAANAGVASSLIIKYFGTKAALYERALIDAFGSSSFEHLAKRGFGDVLVGAVQATDITNYAPPMLALSLGDDVARGIAERVLGRHVQPRVMNWLGGDKTEERALLLLMLSTGYAMFARHIRCNASPDASAGASRRMAMIVEAILNDDDEHPARAPRPS